MNTKIKYNGQQIDIVYEVRKYGEVGAALDGEKALFLLNGMRIHNEEFIEAVEHYLQLRVILGIRGASLYYGPSYADDPISCEICGRQYRDKVREAFYKRLLHRITYVLGTDVHIETPPEVSCEQPTHGNVSNIGRFINRSLDAAGLTRYLYAGYTSFPTFDKMVNRYYSPKRYAEDGEQLKTWLEGVVAEFGRDEETPPTPYPSITADFVRRTLLAEPVDLSLDREFAAMELLDDFYGFSNIRFLGTGGNLGYRGLEETLFFKTGAPVVLLSFGLRTVRVALHSVSARGELRTSPLEQEPQRVWTTSRCFSTDQEEAVIEDDTPPIHILW